MKKILATSALALTMACSVAGAKTVTAHVYGTNTSLSANAHHAMILIEDNCPIMIQSRMSRPFGKALNLGGQVVGYHEYAGCWYKSSSGQSYVVNLPGLTNGWKRMPASEFDKENIDIGN